MVRAVLLLTILSVFGAACRTGSRPDVNKNRKETEAEPKKDSVKDGAALEQKEDKIRIPGSKVFLKKPKGYEVKEGYTTIIKDKHNYIEVMALPQGNYYTNSRSYKRDSLREKKGLTSILTLEKKKVSGYPAKHSCIDGNNGLRWHSLVFGDSSFSVAVNAYHPISDPRPEKKIKEVLSSVEYRSEIKVDPLEDAPFTFNEDTSEFSFANCSSFYFFTLDGQKIKEVSGSDNVVMVKPLFSKYTHDPSVITRQYFNELKKYGLIPKEVRSQGRTEVNGCDAYEAIVECGQDGKTVLVYQLAVIETQADVFLNGAMMQGVINEDKEEVLAEMKKHCHSMEFK